MEYNDYELYYMVKESEDALSLLIKKYEPLYRKLSYFFLNKFKYSVLDIDDLMQQCRFITCYAVDKFNESNNILFYSYLLICLRRGLYNYVSRGTLNKEIYYYMDYEDYDNLEQFKDDKDGFTYTLDKDFEKKIVDFKYNLSTVDSCIFELRYNGFSYKEIATLLDINLKKVDNSLLSTRKKLEKYLLF